MFYKMQINPKGERYNICRQLSYRFASMITKATNTKIHKIENNILTHNQDYSSYKMVANSNRQRKELLHEEERTSTKNLTTVPNSKIITKTNSVTATYSK